jgi:tetratricopeptide (TPR) repeat protein
MVAAAMRGNLREVRTHAANGRREMEALGDWSQVLFIDLNSIVLGLILGGEAGAESAASGFDPNAALDSISPAVRDYQGVVKVLATLGRADEVDDLLQRWQADQIPSSSGPIFEEARKAAAAILAGRSNPDQGFDGLNDLSRELNCSGCYIWERAQFAERAGRLAEARDLLLASLDGGSDDLFQAPIWRIMAHENLGRLYEALGETAEAAEHYGRFAEYWADADPEFQPRVEAARNKAAALSGESSPQSDGQSAAASQGEEGS